MILLPVIYRSLTFPDATFQGSYIILKNPGINQGAEKEGRHKEKENSGQGEKTKGYQIVYY